MLDELIQIDRGLADHAASWIAAHDAGKCRSRTMRRSAKCGW